MLFKRIGYFLATISFLFSIIFSLQAQNTTGKEFWLTFGSNNGNSYTLCDLQIRIVSGEKATTVTIHFTNLENSITHNMSAHEVWTYSLDNTQKQATYNNMTYSAVTNYSIRITSNEPVSVYALNFRNPTQDATNVLPVTALGTDYYQISYTAPGLSAVDCYAMVATQSNTTLYHDRDSVATLDAGEVYYRFSPNNDMTGILVTADNPVAFFALHRGATMPYNVYSSSHLMQQLAPVKTWGKTFFVPSTIITHDRVRIVVSQNNTTINQTGGIVQATLGAQTDLENLQKGQFVELEISDTGCYIVADKPIGVCAYISSYLVGLSTPAQCWIPTIEQMVSRIQIAPFIPKNVLPQYLTNQYALVYTPTATKDNTKVSISGASPTGLTNGSWIDNDSAKMSFYTMPLENDTASYTFTNQKGLIILGYANGFASSYYYLAGSAMRELDAYFFANNVHFGDLEENPFCESTVTFRAELDNMGVEMDSIKWYIDGEEYEQTRDSLEWSRHFDIGEYEIRMWVRFENDDTISKTGTLKIKNCEVNVAFYANNVNISLIDTTFCAKNVVFNAEIEDYTEIKWFITKEGIEEEYVFAYNLKQWNKDFETGDYTIRMEVLLQSGEILNIYGTLQMRLLWIKMRNIRY